jgi:hypothetical protein
MIDRLGDDNERRSDTHAVLGPRVTLDGPRFHHDDIIVAIRLSSP